MFTMTFINVCVPVCINIKINISGLFLCCCCSLRESFTTDVQQMGVLSIKYLNATFVIEHGNNQ